MKRSDDLLLYEQLKKTLKGRIETGALKPGDRILSERLLAEEHAVSRITAKKAVADLVQEGVLEHLPGRRGTFVRRRDGRPGAPRFIAVAIDDVRDSFGAEMLRGIEDFLWGKRIHTLVCNADRDFAKVEEYFQSLLSLGISGVVFAPVIDHGYARNNRRLVALLEKARLPYTLIDRSIPGLLANYAGANHEESSRLISGRLLAAGHRRILLARGLECTSMEERVEGYRNAHVEAGIAVDDRLIVSVNDNLLERDPDPGELARMAALIREAQPFTCFYALNNRLLDAGVRAMESAGIRPGEDVQVASHDKVDRPWLPCLERMPHFVEPTYQMGWEAARILVENIRTPDRAVVQVVLKSTFVPAS
jgi:GntR family transcriptional regulator of arabinose operon